MPVVGRAAAIVGGKKKTRRRSSAAVDRAAAAIAARKMREMNIGYFNNELSSRIAKFFKYEVRDKGWFKGFIIGIIFLAGVLVGVQTYDMTDESALQLIGVLEEIVVTIFIIEIIVKLLAEGRWPWRFFKDGWNVFDFLIVAVGLMPFAGGAVTALRLVRLLRVLKLVRALPKLRILVLGLLKSLSSIAYIGLLLMLLFYLYAVLGVSVFGANDPIHMGTLHIAFLTLFRCATLEDWTDVMYIGMQGCDNYGYDGNEDLCLKPKKQGVMSVAYFCSFVILSSMMILNLFIGVITSSMADAKSDLSRELEDEQAAMREQETDEQMMTKLLHDLQAIMEEVSDEIADFSELERQRHDNAVIQLSGTAALNNKMHGRASVQPNPAELRKTLLQAGVSVATTDAHPSTDDATDKPTFTTNHMKGDIKMPRVTSPHPPVVVAPRRDSPGAEMAPGQPAGRSEDAWGETAGDAVDEGGDPAARTEVSAQSNGQSRRRVGTRIAAGQPEPTAAEEGQDSAGAIPELVAGFTSDADAAHGTLDTLLVPDTETHRGSVSSALGRLPPLAGAQVRVGGEAGQGTTSLLASTQPSESPTVPADADDA